MTLWNQTGAVPFVQNCNWRREEYFSLSHWTDRAVGTGSRLGLRLSLVLFVNATTSKRLGWNNTQLSHLALILVHWLNISLDVYWKEYSHSLNSQKIESDSANYVYKQIFYAFIPLCFPSSTNTFTDSYFF